MINKKTWKEFRESGLLWFINTILHAFGWAIVYEIDESGDIIKIYPARIKFRGFSPEVNDHGYFSLGKYLKEHAAEIQDEAWPSQEVKIND